MTERRATAQPTKPMESWESWPLWALGLSNGLNIVLWYVLSMSRVDSPELPIGVLGALAAWLPLIVVGGGVAQALSLDGALIATIAGARHGRRGVWTWLTIVGAGLFSAAISYAVHSGRIDQLPILHVASAVNLVFYNMHLAQPRKPLTDAETTVRTRLQTPILAKTRAQLPDRASVAIGTNFPCRVCGEGFETLGAVSQHARKAHPKQTKSTATYVEAARNSDQAENADTV